jgi:hypothetical protein
MAPASVALAPELTQAALDVFSLGSIAIKA